MKKLLSVVAVMGAVVLLTAATKGDAPSKAMNGRVMVQVYDGSTVVFDGGTGSATKIPCMSEQNTLALYNNGLIDGGTGTKPIYCGYKVTTATPTTGFPVPYQGFLSIDITSQLAACTVSLYCQAADTNNSEVDVRWMVVK